MLKAIIYDKDGTLIKFDPFWVPVTKAAIRELFAVSEAVPGKLADLVAEAETAVGIHGEAADTKGKISSGTYAEIAELVNGLLSDRGITRTMTRRDVEAAIRHNLGYGKIEAACESLREVLETARSRAALFVVTTDNPEITAKCLNALNIADLFDGVYCDDGATPAKPDPAVASGIMQKFGAAASEIYMVGDTMTDARFAANAKINFVSVGGDERARAAADYAADDVKAATLHILNEA